MDDWCLRKFFVPQICVETAMGLIERTETKLEGTNSCCASDLEEPIRGRNGSQTSSCLGEGLL
jgi:hypothetical protein